MPTATLDGGRVHFHDTGGAGAGPPAPVLVLVHAFPLTSAMWQGQLDRLSGTARVVAPDLPGFGASDPPPGGHSIDAYADAVARLLDHLGLDDVVLGGLSIGGYVTFSFLRRHRHRVRAVVLADTRAASDTPAVLERRASQQAEVAAGRLDAVLDAQVEALLAEATRRDRPELAAQVRALMATVPARTVVGGLEAMKHRADATAELADIDVPALVVVGEHDGPSPPDVARQMHEALPRSRLAVLPGAGHLSNLEAPDRFDAEVRRFLEDVGGR